MDLTPHVAALRDDLAAAAAVGDEATSRAGSTLAAALEPAVRLALMNALSDLAAEIDAGLDDHSVSLRLRGREVDVVIDHAAGPGTDGHETDPGGFFAGPSSSPFAAPGAGRFDKPGHPGHPGHPFPGRPGAGPDVGDISRMTLRIVDQIKGQAERAAAAQGMSLNSWVSQAVQGALRGQGNWAEGWHQGFGWDRPDERSGPDRPGTERTGSDTGSDSGSGSGSDSGPGPGSGSGSDTGSGPTDADHRESGPEARDRRDDPGDGGVHGWVRG